MEKFKLLAEKFKSIPGASTEVVDAIAGNFAVRSFPKGSIIISQGTVCDRLYFINKGMLRSYIDAGEEEVTTWVALPGTVETSAGSFFKQVPSATNVEALDDVELLELSRKDYYKLLKENIHFNAFAAGMMEDFYLRMEDKFFSSLSLSASERYLRMREKYPKHFKTVPHKYLASILGIKPETFSRLRKKYEA